MNNILEKIMEIWYFKNTHRDESNDISYDIIYLCILIEKYDQSKLNQITNFQLNHLLRVGENTTFDVILFSLNNTILYW